MQAGATVTAVWREPGKHLDLFATGSDGAVWSIWWNNRVGWRPEGWRLIHAEIKMQPGATVTAVWREPGKHLGLFATGTDGAVWSISWNDQPSPAWGLLANARGVAQPVKGVYFFAGERGGNYSTYTAHPLDSRDEHWNTIPSTREWVMDRMVEAHVNTVVMSYWSNVKWSPMDLVPAEPGTEPSKIGSESLKGVLDAVEGRPLVVMPAIESGIGWEFSRDFPISPGSSEVAPGLVQRIGWLVELFNGRMHLWARIYDREGDPRYVVNIIHAASELIDPHAPGADDVFANGFDAVAAKVRVCYGISVGFTLDTIGNQRYSAHPSKVGPALEQTASVLAIQGFASEVFSPPGLVKNAPPCPERGDWRLCPPYDNNVDNLERIADWKRDAVRDWVKTGVPVILDVSNGFDGRVVWAEVWHGFWGDNLDYTDDRWRNWMSELKGPGIKGITFNTWNGYTEGYAAVPTREHGWTVYNWLTDLLEPPPWDYSHMHYVNGAGTHRVYGAICEKWINLGADRGFGAPISEELPTARGGRMQYFADGKAIYWSGMTGAHALYGLIAKTYREEGADGSCLGLPISDEEESGKNRVCHFERGRIDWSPGDKRGRITCW